MKNIKTLTSRETEKETNIMDNLFKNASMTFIRDIKSNPLDLTNCLEILKSYHNEVDIQNLTFKVCDETKCELYKYLCDKFSGTEDNSSEMIESMKILDSVSNFTTYLLKSMRIGLMSFNDILHIDSRDTLTRSKLSNVFASIARIVPSNEKEQLTVIKSLIDDALFSRDIK